MGESDAFVHAMILSLEEDGREGQTWRIGRSCSSWLLGHTSRMHRFGDRVRHGPHVQSTQHPTHPAPSWSSAVQCIINCGLSSHGPNWVATISLAAVLTPTAVKARISHFSCNSCLPTTWSTFCGQLSYVCVNFFLARFFTSSSCAV